MKHLVITATKVAGLIALSFQLSACGDQGWFKDAKFRQYNVNSDTYGEIAATLETQDVSLPSVELPIYHPRRPTEQLGTLALRNGIVVGQTELALSVNLSRIAKLPTHTNDATLPNGAMIPISGYDQTKLMTFAVGNAGSKAYVILDMSNKQAILGVALVIDALNIGRNGNLFLPFNTNGLRGVAGIFLGAQPKQTGFALFADAGQLLSGFGAQSVMVKATPKPAKFKTQKPSSSTMQKLQMRVYKLNSENARIYVD